MGLLDQFPNLDDETFEEIVKDARLLIPQFARESWTDHNVHDPGITFLELFAWLAEMQMYQLNRVTEKNYRKFLKLVGISPYDAKPAKVDITFDIKNKATFAEKNDTLVEKGTKITTELDGNWIVFETEEDINVIQSNLKTIISRSNLKVVDNTAANDEDDIYFSAFGEKGGIGSTLELGFNEALPQKDIQITFDLFDEDLPSPVIDDSDPVFSVSLSWEYLNDGEKWNELTLKKDTTLALNRSGRINFDIPSNMGKNDEKYWIRCLWKDGHYEVAPLINRILINTIPAVQVEDIEEIVPIQKVNDPDKVLIVPDKKVELKVKPVLTGSLKIIVEGSSDEKNMWIEKDDFESSGPEDKHYLFNPEEGEITFGNGLNGRIPVEEIKISYKTTLGQKGNVPKGQKWVSEETGSGIIIKENYKQATGGQDAESIEQAKSRAKKDFRGFYRAITSEDYEQLALSTPGLRVSRAKAIPNYHPKYPCIDIPDSTTVVIVPYARGDENTPVPGKNFLQTVSSFLDTRRLITADLHVIGPEYVKIAVTCNVRIKKKSSPTEVTKRIQNELNKFLDPLKGGPDGKGWPFGRAVYKSEIYQIINNIEGLDYASGVSLSTESDNGQQNKNVDIIKIPPIALVVSGEHKIIIIE